MIGQVIGSYRILEKIGEGGMGEVFKGLDEMLEREVAIKILRPELASRQDIVDRFRTEAVALARLNHPNIVLLYSFFHHQEQYFMVLEYVRGDTLDKLITRYGAMPWRQAVTLVCQALDGLEQAHRLAVVHRDIKPANMILTQAGTLKMMDFGIARILEKARQTRTGQLFGTLEYMSPEQIQGRETDARSDLYSVGAVLYEMLTGHIPFERGSDYDLIRSHVEEIPRPPSDLAPQLPQALEAAVMRALTKSPQDRFASAAAFRATLETLLRTTSISSKGTNQRVSVPPETRMSIPWTPDLAHAEPGHELAEEPQEPVRSVERTAIISPKQSPMSYLRKYPGVAVFLVLLGIAALLVGISNRWQNRALVSQHPNLHEELLNGGPAVDTVTADKLAKGLPGVEDRSAEPIEGSSEQTSEKAVSEESSVEARNQTSDSSDGGVAPEQPAPSPAPVASLPEQGVPVDGFTPPALTSPAEKNPGPLVTAPPDPREDTPSQRKSDNPKKKPSLKRNRTTSLGSSNTNGWNIRK